MPLRKSSMCCLAPYACASCVRPQTPCCCEKSPLRATCRSSFFCYHLLSVTRSAGAMQVDLVNVPRVCIGRKPWRTLGRCAQVARSLLLELLMGGPATTDWRRAGALMVVMLADVSEKVLTHKEHCSAGGAGRGAQGARSPPARATRRRPNDHDWRCVGPLPASVPAAVPEGSTDTHNLLGGLLTRRGAPQQTAAVSLCRLRASCLTCTACHHLCKQSRTLMAICDCGAIFLRILVGP